jgi:hypothetical protein
MEDFADFIDRAGTEGYADIVDAAGGVQVEVEIAWVPPSLPTLTMRPLILVALRFWLATLPEPDRRSGQRLRRPWPATPDRPEAGALRRLSRAR